MDNTGLENWDEARYKELNTYFRIKIELLLQANPHLLRDKNLSLSDLVAEFGEEDKQRWQEFMQLDKLKLEADMWRHLHGEGSGFKPGFGFTNPEDVTW
ncbi:hypothetical protein FVR03_16105 [Pontibacter qinzhouensis]|uniref:Uncharacterized protein n=1 Tax=Pontibacter qinzhouensis TaxID=2603253 RepID=A0A5C8JJB5_9BACT|nr:hypothetical protein [Pontibacter qinzhouensis]TXK37003.1 hypothetical protein FVR03_16105 [Pontibacter qinzhouensis]